MKGIVVQFRRGNRTVHEKHFILSFGSKNREEASKLVGNKVVWTSPGKEKKKIKGKISSAHGNKGMVRAIFERGLPGQALTTEIEMSLSHQEQEFLNASRIESSKFLKSKESPGKEAESEGTGERRKK